MRESIHHLLLTAACLAGLALSQTATGATQMKGFDLEGALVPIEQIHSGGPPRDGIPSIEHPKFIASAAARYLRPDDLVVSVTVG